MWTSLLAISILPALAISITLPQPQDTFNSSQPPTLSPSLLSADNSSAIFMNSSLGKILQINCDPVRYGRNLKVASCKNIFNFLAQDDTPTVFAERGAVQPHDMNLPYRITSSEYLILEYDFILLLLRPVLEQTALCSDMIYRRRTLLRAAHPCRRRNDRPRLSTGGSQRCRLYLPTLRPQSWCRWNSRRHRYVRLLSSAT